MGLLNVTPLHVWKSMVACDDMEALKNELPDEFGVDFEEVEYPKTVQDQILKDNFDIENNLSTRAKIMVRDNKDLSTAQAQKIIDENRKVNEKESPNPIFTQLRKETGQDQQSGD